jgi:hypothetical protein
LFEQNHVVERCQYGFIKHVRVSFSLSQIYIEISHVAYLTHAHLRFGNIHMSFTFFSRRMVDGLPDGSLVDLEVTSFHGKRLQLSVTRGLNGWQLQQLILQKLSRPGRRLLLQHGAVPLKLQETLEQQGITGRRSNKNQLYYIYVV